MILDSEGHPDTSFLAKIPADTPFTFQTLDCHGMLLNMSQTWHQVRPGEMRVDCGGCHAHSQQPLAFDDTAAAAADFSLADLTLSTPLLTVQNGQPATCDAGPGTYDVEFLRDIRPILQAKCVSCHQGSTPDGGLNLADLSLVDGVPNDGFQFPGDYYRLAADEGGDFAPSLLSSGNWRQTNASRYVRMFQSRRSLLIWKIFGQRLDGWSNADHPTEAVPGNPATLPPGADPNEADIDYTGSVMLPPPALPLSDEEKLLFVRWIDLGAPIDTGNATYGWLLDDLKPTLTISSPRPGLNRGRTELIRIGIADANSGIAAGSLSVTADFSVAGRAAGSELADLFLNVGAGIFSLPLATPMPRMDEAHIHASVRDVQGNITRLNLRFSTQLGEDDVFHDSFE